MERTPTTVRLSPYEKRLLRTAARRDGEEYWSTWLREVALERAVERLEEELPELKREEDEALRGE